MFASPSAFPQPTWAIVPVRTVLPQEAMMASVLLYTRTAALCVALSHGAPACPQLPLPDKSVGH